MLICVLYRIINYITPPNGNLGVKIQWKVLQMQVPRCDCRDVNDKVITKFFLLTLTDLPLHLFIQGSSLDYVGKLIKKQSEDRWGALASLVHLSDKHKLGNAD